MVLQQVGGEAVAERVAGDALVEAGGAGRGADGFLQAAFVQVMAPRHAGARVCESCSEGKTYCQIHSRAALGNFRSKASGR